MPNYLATSCSASPSIWHFISRDTWKVDFSRKFIDISSDEWNSLHWNDTLGLYIIRGDFEKGIKTICLIDSEIESVQFCLEMPYFYSSAYFSPDGEWMEIQVPTEGTTKFGFISSSCLKNRVSDCEPYWIEQALIDDLGLITTNATWHPNGGKIYYLKDGCILENETTFWEYDLEAEQSKIIASFPACLQFVTLNDQAIWSPNGTGIVIYWGKRNPRYYLLSILSGEMNELPINENDFVTGSFTIPED
jgi:hypothetical protein